MKTQVRRSGSVSNFLPFVGWMLLASVFIFLSFGVKIESKPTRSARNIASEPSIRLSWNR